MEDFSASEILRLDSVSERRDGKRYSDLDERKQSLWERTMMRNSYSG